MMRAGLSVALLWLLTVATPLAAREGETPAGRSVATLNSVFFVGAWETHNVEFSRTVRIVWTLWEDGRLLYHFGTGPDGALVPGSTGTWALSGDEMHERWNRADGTRDFGRGRVERIDDNTIRLTIIDNGHAEYKGLVRIYRRLGPPQLARLKPFVPPSASSARRWPWPG